MKKSSRLSPKQRIVTAIATSALLSLVVSGCAAGGADADAQSNGEASKGGTITAALTGDPQTLDSGLSGSQLTYLVGQNIFEGLFALDETYTPQPMLAESYEVSDDLKTYTFNLRQDVKFHDGSDFDSGDVVASLQRWALVSPSGKAAAPGIVSITAVDPHTVEVVLSAPRFSFVGDLAFFVQSAIMLPEEIATAAGENPLSTEQVIGTGPYELEKMTPGQRVDLIRFEDYVPRTEDMGGFAGAKHAYADEIDFVYVADATQRLNGLKTGQWNWAQTISADDVAAAEKDPSIVVEAGATASINTIYLNNKDVSIFANPKARQALSLLVDPDVIAKATAGPDWLWSPLSPSLVTPSNAPMFSDAGSEEFFDYDPVRAKALFEEAGVTAETPIKIMTTQTYPQFYQWAVMIQAELEKIDVPTEIQVYDYPTLTGLQASEPESWDLSMTYFVGSVTSPSQILWLTPGWRAGYESEALDALMLEYMGSADQKQATAVVDKIQAQVYEDMPVVQLGAVSDLGVYSKTLEFPNDWTQVLWNAHVTK